METLIRIFTAVLDFFSAIGSFIGALSKPFQDIWSVETLIVGIMIVVAVAGMGAFGPWTRKRKPGEYPWR
jgi:hypothetical protein